MGKLIACVVFVLTIFFSGCSDQAEKQSPASTAPKSTAPTAGQSEEEHISGDETSMDHLSGAPSPDSHMSGN